MKIANRQNGFTLIEIIVSLAIIGIIAAVFLNIFGSGVTNIFNMGKKSQANVLAQSLVDRIYESSMTIDAKTLADFAAVRAAVETKTNTVLTAEVGAGGFEEVTSVNFNNAYINGTSKNVRYCIISSSNTLVAGNTYPLIKLRLYYDKGKSSVTLNIPIIKQAGKS